jgi:hypothetical protein
VNDLSWLEEAPSKESKARVLRAAEIEIERFARRAQAAPRRNLLSIFSAEFLAAIPVAGVAGLLGFWLVAEEKSTSRLQVAADDPLGLLDSSLEVGDVEVVSNLEFLEDFDLLEELKDEELPS